MENSSASQPPLGAGAIPGPNRAQALFCATDWGASALGPAASWPACIRTALAIVLQARQPMALAWGPQFNIFYNDSYGAILGARAASPAATFGQPVTHLWPELAADILPVLGRAMGGQAEYVEDAPFLIQRGGATDTLYLTVSTSPVVDADGVVAGVFCTFADTTARVAARRERDSAVAELAATGERLRLATELAELGTFDHDLVTGVVHWSAATKRHFGLSPDAVVTPAVYSTAFHPDDRARVLDEVAAFYAAPGAGRYACDYRTVGIEDGRERWLAARGQLFFDAAGQPRRLIGTTLDITDRKQAEAQARLLARDALVAADANAKYRTFFSQGAHFAVLADCAGSVLEVNRAALEDCGYTRADVLGRPLWDCAWWRAAPASKQAVRAALAGAAGGRETHHKLSYLTADGAERIGQLTVAPVLDDQGRILYLAATASDVTEREGVEARLRLLDAIGEATRVALAPEAILECATRMLGQYLHVTRVAYADLEPDHDRFTIRHDWTVPGAASTTGVYSLDLFGSRIKAAMRAGHTMAIDHVDRELPAADGGDMFNRIAIQAIICCPLVKDGQLVAMLAVHQDCPRSWSAAEVALVEAVGERCWAHIERVRAVQALHDTDRRKSEFLAVLAHELRNPLAPIRNGIDMLRISANNPATAARVREMMGRQVAHMAHLINDLLDVARVNNGKVVLQLETVELRQLLANAVETAGAALEAARHTITLDAGAEPVLLQADPVRLAQVLGNLLSNAVKYTAPGGRLHLSARRSGEMVEMRLRDNGIGIAREHLASVFDMFTQVARNLERARGGLGIGLSLVQRLVQLHGGTVSVDSAGLGEGSVFTVRLPAPRTFDVLAGAGSLGAAGASALAQEGVQVGTQAGTPAGTRAVTQAGTPAGTQAVTQAGMQAGTPVGTSVGTAVGTSVSTRTGSSVSTQGGTQAGTPVGTSASTVLRILVADDNVDAADTLCALLGAIGHSTCIAYDGAAALDVARRYLPQLALLDLGMPHMDGFETARRMRADPALQGVTLVAVTGWGAASDRARARAAGFDHHLLKPASMQQVQEIIAHLPLGRQGDAP